jgi:ABC-type Na+ transport system ATPase subunit NatA
MLVTNPKGVVQKVNTTILDVAASGLDMLYETVKDLPPGVQSDRVDQQLAVLSSTSVISLSIVNSIKKPRR